MSLLVVKTVVRASVLPSQFHRFYGFLGLLMMLCNLVGRRFLGGGGGETAPPAESSQGQPGMLSVAYRLSALDDWVAGELPPCYSGVARYRAIILPRKGLDDEEVGGGNAVGHRAGERWL